MKTPNTWLIKSATGLYLAAVYLAACEADTATDIPTADSAWCFGNSTFRSHYAPWRPEPNTALPLQDAAYFMQSPALTTRFIDKIIKPYKPALAQLLRDSHLEEAVVKNNIDLFRLPEDLDLDQKVALSSELLFEAVGPPTDLSSLSDYLAAVGNIVDIIVRVIKAAYITNRAMMMSSGSAAPLEQVPPAMLDLFDSTQDSTYQALLADDFVENYHPVRTAYVPDAVFFSHRAYNDVPNLGAPNSHDEAEQLQLQLSARVAVKPRTRYYNQAPLLGIANFFSRRRLRTRVMWFDPLSNNFSYEPARGRIPFSYTFKGTMVTDVTSEPFRADKEAQGLVTFDQAIREDWFTEVTRDKIEEGGAPSYISVSRLHSITVLPFFIQGMPVAIITRKAFGNDARWSHFSVLEWRNPETLAKYAEEQKDFVRNFLSLKDLSMNRWLAYQIYWIGWSVGYAKKINLKRDFEHDDVQHLSWHADNLPLNPIALFVDMETTNPGADEITDAEQLKLETSIRNKIMNGVDALKEASAEITLSDNDTIAILETAIEAGKVGAYESNLYYLELPESLRAMLAAYE